MKNASFTLKIFNSSGQQVAPAQSLQLPEGHRTISLDVSGFPAGFYEIELATGVGSKSVKFVKQRQ